MRGILNGRVCRAANVGWLLAACLVLVGLPAAATINYQNLGTAAPPASMGSFTMTPFSLAPQTALANGTTVTTIPGSPVRGALTTSATVVKQTIGSGWATWSHGYTGPVYTDMNATSLTLTLPYYTSAFYFYIEPNTFGTFNITATTDSGATSGPVGVAGSSGATGFGFYTDGTESILSIQITAVAGANGFAIGEFGLARSLHFVQYQDLGTDAPPANLGPYQMVPFDKAAQAALGDYASVSTIPGCPITGALTTSASVTKRTVPASWATWSHGYTGPVFLSSGLSITLTLPPNTRAFQFYAESMAFGTFDFTATTNSGTTSGSVSINGNAGARGFGFYTDEAESLLTITITASSGALGFSMGEFAIASTVNFVATGTGPPPTTACAYTLIPFDTTPQAAIPDLTSGTTIPGSPVPGQVTTSPAFVKRTVPGTWNNWSHGYTGPVFMSPGTSGQLNLPPNTGAFFFTAEGDMYGTWHVTVTSDNGRSWGATTVTTPGGATGFAACSVTGEPIASVTISVDAPANRFSISELAIALVPTTPVFNDECATPRDVFYLPYTNLEEIDAATTGLSDPHATCVDKQNRSVWYQYVPGQSAIVEVDTLGTDYDTVLSAYTGPCGTPLTPVPGACNDDSNGGLQSQITFSADQGTPYLLYVSAYQTYGTGTLRFHLDATPCVLTDCSATVPASGVATIPVDFAGSPVTVPGDCGTTAYDWDFGDLTAHGTGASASHTYATAGTYNWTMTASLNGGTCTKTGSIMICPVIVLSPGSLPGGTAGTSYSQSVTASGGTGPYTYAKTSGTLPSGLTLGAGGGLTGTPTAAGTFDFVVTATDAASCTGSQAYSVTVTCPTITLTPASLPGGTAGTSYSQSVTASGGTGPYTYARTSGTLPNGLTLGAGGTLTGTPTAAGTFDFVVTATDANSCTGNRAYSITMTCPTITVSPSSLLGGMLGIAYGQSVTASGGTGPYTYAVTSGALPDGLTLGPGGALSGTPTALGNFDFTVTATDANACTGSQPYSMQVACPSITLSPASLPGGAVGSAYNQTITASGGTGPYTYAVTLGSLPSGLSLGSGGALSGTPTVTGPFSITVTATDHVGCTGARSYSFSIACGTITLSPASLPGGTAGVGYSQTITASGGTGPYTFTKTSGTLPTGLSLSSSGVLSGTPTAVNTFSFTITATDANSCTGSKTYSVTVACPSITITPSSPLAGGTVGTAYSVTILAIGGTAPYTYAKTSGTLPTGLTLTSGGALSGTPTAAGTFNFTVTATDASSCTGSLAYSLTMSCPTISLSPGSPLAPGTVGSAYGQTITASGGTAPYAFTVTSGALPAGLVLNSAGVVSGTPTAAGVFNFTVTATDANSCTGNRAYSVTMTCPTISLSPGSPLPGGTVGVAYSQLMTASGGAAPYTFARTSGTVPPGLTLGSSGTLSGSPAAAGTFIFTVTATDSHACSGSLVYSVTMTCPAISIAPGGPLPVASIGRAYNQTLTASGGTAPYTFSVTTGTLPAGLSLSSGGLLSGTPTTAGNSSFTVMATDAHSCTASRDYSIAVVPPPVITMIKKAGAPFRFVVTGSNLQNPIQVFIGSDATPWSTVTWKNSGKIIIGGGSSLKARVPKATPTDFTFVNADGGVAVVPAWTW